MIGNSSILSFLQEETKITITSTRESMDAGRYFIDKAKFNIGKRGFSFLSLFIILFAASTNLAAQDAGPKQRQKTEKISKWEKKARKQEAKADRLKKRLIKVQKRAKVPSNAKIVRLQRKIDRRLEKAAKFRYKGKSKEHAKAQTAKTKRRMKKNLKRHKKYKRKHN